MLITHQSLLKGRIMLAIDLEEFPKALRPCSRQDLIFPPLWNRRITICQNQMISYLSNNFQVDDKFNIVTIIHIDYCTTNWFGIHNQYYYIL